MQTVYLNGELSKFGEKWETSCNTIPEIIRLIDCQVPEFRKHLIDASEAGLEYTIQKGKDFIDEEELLLSIGEEDIIITEVPAGSKGGGLKAILGIVLVVTAIALSGGAAAFPSYKYGGLGGGIGGGNGGGVGGGGADPYHPNYQQNSQGA